MVYHQVHGWVYVALSGAIAFCGGCICYQGRRPWFKLATPWMILMAIYAEHTAAALLQALDMVIFMTDNSESVSSLEVLARALNVLSIVDVLLLCFFVDIIRKYFEDGSEKCLARTMVFGKFFLLIFLHAYSHFLRKYYGIFIMVTIGIVGILCFARLLVNGAHCFGTTTQTQNNQSTADIIQEKFIEFLCFTALNIMVANWFVAFFNLAEFLIPGGRIVQVAAPIVIIFMLCNHEKKVRLLLGPNTHNNNNFEVSYRASVTNASEAEPDIYFHSLSTGYQSAELVPVSSARDRITSLILDLEGSDNDDQGDMDIWEFMKTESAREDRKEAKEREMVSWGQFLKESARNPDIEEANQFGECSTTVHAVVHHLEETVDETAEVEEAEVQGGASQTKLPDIANQYQENGQEEETGAEETEEEAEKMSLDSYQGDRCESSLSCQEIAVSPDARPAKVPALAITGNETKEMKDNELPKEQDAPTVTDKPTEHD